MRHHLMCDMAHRLLATGWHSARQVALSNLLAAAHPLRMEIVYSLPFHRCWHQPQMERD